MKEGNIITCTQEGLIALGLVQAQNGLSHTKSEAHLMIETQPIRSLIKLDGTTVEIIARADCQNFVYSLERRRETLSSGGQPSLSYGVTVRLRTITFTVCPFVYFAGCD